MSITITSRQSGNDEVVDVRVPEQVYSITLDAVDRELCANGADRAWLVGKRVAEQVQSAVRAAMEAKS